jgi:hypothetical protein
MSRGCATYDQFSSLAILYRSRCYSAFPHWGSSVADGINIYAYFKPKLTILTTIGILLPLSVFFILTHPVNFFVGRNWSARKKTHDFRQNVDYTLFKWVGHWVLPRFKCLLMEYFKTALKVNYRSDSQTWKSICLICKTARSLSAPISCCF